MKLFILTLLNGLTLAALYFIVACGFSLVFGLMRNVNLAHGTLYLLGGYIGWDVSEATNNWWLGAGAGFMSMAMVGYMMQRWVFARMPGQDLRQTLITIGISIIVADLMLANWGGETYQFNLPEAFYGATRLPFVGLKYTTFRLLVLLFAIIIGVSLWLLMNRTRIGMMIRAGVDDKEILAASGVNVQRIFLLTFAIGAGLAGLAGVIGGSALSLSPGEDLRYLMASLVVVIVGGMGSIVGAAIGALLIGLADTFGLAYSPTYGVVYTFVIMVVVLAIRPQGIMGGR